MFKQLAGLIETKGLKMLWNVQTRWVSLIKPLRRLFLEYQTLIYKMIIDLNDNNKSEVCFCGISLRFEFCFILSLSWIVLFVILCSLLLW